MEIEVLRTVAAWQCLAPEWNALLAVSATRVPFLRPEFLAAWWPDLGGGGEWPRGELHIVTARADGILVAIAPLFASANHDGAPVVSVIGSDALSDYLDIVAKPEHSERFIAELCTQLDSADAPPWVVFDLYNVPDESPTFAALSKAAAERGWACEREIIITSSSAPLPGDWETYLASLGKKPRHELRRKLRNAERRTRLRWQTRATESDIESVLNLMTLNPDKLWLTAPRLRRQFHALLAAASEGEFLRLANLEIDGAAIAAYILFDFDGRLWVYNSGHDPAFRHLSPGIVLLGMIARWGVENGRAAIDFLRGDEPYKRDFGTVERPVWRITVARETEPTPCRPAGGG